MADFDPVSYMMGQKSGGGGGGGGSSTLSGLTDVDISNPSDGQTLVYDAASSKWVNGSGGGGGILFASIDMSTFTLDKTWQEIYDADMVVFTVRDSEDRAKGIYMLSNVYIEGTEGVNASYVVTAYNISSEAGEPVADAFLFSASTRNDYPAINSPD